MDPAIEPAPAAADEDLVCPLCGYSLRGLTTPRCPECGYAFEWEELRQKQREHPYLFEHADRRKVRSFLKTLLWGLRPFRFWRDIRPTHDPRPRRIARYWLWTALAALLIVACPFVHYSILMTRDHLRLREMELSWTPGGWTRGKPVPPILQQRFEEQYPLPSSMRFYELMHRDFARQIPFIAQVASLLALWPWLSYSALLVLRVSMRRARIHPAHIARCVVYSFDVLALLAPLILAAVVIHAVQATGPTTPWSKLVYDHAFTMNSGAEKRSVLAIMFLVQAIGAFRLLIAYARYLRFPHAFAVVFTNQLIVWLFAVVLLLWVDERISEF